MSVTGTAKVAKDEGVWSIKMGLIWFGLLFPLEQTPNWKQGERGNAGLKEHQSPQWIGGGCGELRVGAN